MSAVVQTVAMGAFTVQLVSGPRSVNSLHEAALAVVDEIDGPLGCMGSTEWYAKIRTARGALVRDAKGAVVARVSYNGRLWSADGKVALS